MEGLNAITEFVAGFLLPGRPLANMMIKAYGYMTMSQVLRFLHSTHLSVGIRFRTRLEIGILHENPSSSLIQNPNLGHNPIVPHFQMIIDNQGIHQHHGNGLGIRKHQRYLYSHPTKPFHLSRRTSIFHRIYNMGSHWPPSDFRTRSNILSDIMVFLVGSYITCSFLLFSSFANDKCQVAEVY